jgi:hypothetical protein
MQSMTYGEMPTQEDFDEAFSRAEDEEGRTGFSFGNDPRVGTCELDATELWAELQKAREEYEEGDDEAGDWCSSVLSTLGFEWV